MDSGSPLASMLEQLVWYTDGSRTDQGTGAKIYMPSLRLLFSLEKITPVFQAEVFAIFTCVCNIQNIPGLKSKVYICSDTQAALKALSAVKVTSMPIWQ
jgi:hypothetical protein